MRTTKGRTQSVRPFVDVTGLTLSRVLFSRIVDTKGERVRVGPRVHRCHRYRRAKCAFYGRDRYEPIIDDNGNLLTDVGRGSRTESSSGRRPKSCDHGPLRAIIRRNHPRAVDSAIVEHDRAFQRERRSGGRIPVRLRRGRRCSRIHPSVLDERLLRGGRNVANFGPQHRNGKSRRKILLSMYVNDEGPHSESPALRRAACVAKLTRPRWRPSPACSFDEQRHCDG